MSDDERGIYSHKYVRRLDDKRREIIKQRDAARLDRDQLQAIVNRDFEWRQKEWTDHNAHLDRLRNINRINNMQIEILKGKLEGGPVECRNDQQAEALRAFGQDVGEGGEIVGGKMRVGVQATESNPGADIRGQIDQPIDSPESQFPVSTPAPYTTIEPLGDMQPYSHFV